MQVVRQDCRDHAVVVAVGDERGLGDGRQIVGRAAPPLLDGLQLGQEARDLHWGVAVLRALGEASDEGPASGLAGGVPVEEEELLGVGPGEGRPDDVVVREAGDLVDVLPTLGSRAGQDQLADEFGVLIASTLSGTRPVDPPAP